MSSYDYDCIVIGGGAAGLSAAFTTKGLGRKTAIVEKNRIGGECTWTGCIPSKTLIKAAGEFRGIKNAGNWVIKADGIRIDTKLLMEKVRQTIESVYSGETPEKLRAAGIDVLEGEAEFEDFHNLRIAGEKVSADKIIICTGTRPGIPSGKGFGDVDILTNENLFNLEKLPESIAVIGAGAIAIEMAQALNRLNTRVTIIQRSGRILKKEDEEISEALMRILEAEGVRLVLNSEIISVEEKLGRKILTVRTPDGEEIFESEAIFVAAGRVVDLEKMKLEKAGINYDDKGIQVDEHMQTSAPGIYAAGDVAGPWRFSHMAYYQGITAGRNASIPIKKKMDYSTVAWCLFTDPELAHLGVTEDEALSKCGKKGCKVFVEKYSDLDRAATDHSKNGFVKVIADKRGKILGAHILGARAGEIMHELSILKGLDQPLYKLNDIIHIYPTYADVLRKLAQKAYVEKLSEQPIMKGLRKVTSVNKRADDSGKAALERHRNKKKKARKGKWHE